MPRPDKGRNAPSVRLRRMTLIDRYLLRQLLGPTLAALGALVGVAMLSQALGGFDLIVEQRQSALVFLKIVSLAMPLLVTMILPIALFVATLVTFNRLHTEQEIVVCFAGGMTRWRVVAPALRIAVVAALLSLASLLFLQPLAQRETRDTLFAVKTDLAATMIREGQFTHPAEGLTVYVQTVEPGGLLRNLVINERRPGDGVDSTFSAAEGRILKQNGRPTLLMRDGASQSITNKGVLNVLRFDEYLYDLSAFMATGELVTYKISDRYLHELVFPDLRHDWERNNRSKMLAEAHFRLSAPLYNIAFVLMALAAVIGGAFSRVGYGRRIAAWGAAAAVVRIFGFGAPAAAESAPWLNVLQYAIPLAACFAAARVIFKQSVHGAELGALSNAGRRATFELEPA